MTSLSLTADRVLILRTNDYLPTNIPFSPVSLAFVLSKGIPLIWGQRTGGQRSRGCRVRQGSQELIVCWDQSLEVCELGQRVPAASLMMVSEEVAGSQKLWEGHWAGAPKTGGQVSLRCGW